MKRLIRTASITRLLLSAALLASLSAPVAQAQTCGSGASTTLIPGITGRPANTNVTVYIDPAFQGEARAAVMAAFNNWQASNGPGGNNTGVTFTFTDTEGGPNSHSVRRDAPTGTVRGYTDTDHLNGVITGAQTHLSPTVTNYDAILEVMVHEIGHGMGLDDCTGCSTSDSVMSAGPPAGADPNTVVGRPTSPTACDNAAVSAGTLTAPVGGGGGGSFDGDGRNEISDGWSSCTPWYRNGIISYDGGKTWYLEYSIYEGCW
jgi:hypothetical protein